MIALSKAGRKMRYSDITNRTIANKEGTTILMKNLFRLLSDISDTGIK